MRKQNTMIAPQSPKARLRPTHFRANHGHQVNMSLWRAVTISYAVYVFNCSLLFCECRRVTKAAAIKQSYLSMYDFITIKAPPALFTMGPGIEHSNVLSYLKLLLV